MSDDKRLIEDYLPIVAISAEASREKSFARGTSPRCICGGRGVRWWLVGRRSMARWCRRRSSCPMAGATRRRNHLGGPTPRSSSKRLCKYPGNPAVIAEAQQHILEAHAERLTKETGKKVTVEDIVAGQAPRPKVLDMFAGGGAIPLEALRLGCEAYALDLNPVAHIIQLCTLVYPQKYGKPDPTARGMTGPKERQRRNHLGRAGRGSPLLGRVGAEQGQSRDRRPLPAHPRPRIHGRRRTKAENDDERLNRAAERDGLCSRRSDDAKGGFATFRHPDAGSTPKAT